MKTDETVITSLFFFIEKQISCENLTTKYDELLMSEGHTSMVYLCCPVALEQRFGHRLFSIIYVI